MPKRLLLRLAEHGLLIKKLLLDRQFFMADVLEYLQSCQVPFVMPLARHGRKPKRKQVKVGPPDAARWEVAPYEAARLSEAGGRKLRLHVNGEAAVGFVPRRRDQHKSHRHQLAGSRRTKKLLHGGWQIRGTPFETREPYRRRFGIESSYRQLGLAGIHACITDPVLRLFFVLVALVL